MTEVLDSNIQNYQSKTKKVSVDDNVDYGIPDTVSADVDNELEDPLDTHVPLTDTLTSSTLTAVLSSKWQVRSFKYCLYLYFVHLCNEF